MYSLIVLGEIISSSETSKRNILNWIIAVLSHSANHNSSSGDATASIGFGRLKMFCKTSLHEPVAHMIFVDVSRCTC